MSAQFIRVALLILALGNLMATLLVWNKLQRIRHMLGDVLTVHLDRHRDEAEAERQRRPAQGTGQSSRPFAGRA